MIPNSNVAANAILVFGCALTVPTNELNAYLKLLFIIQLIYFILFISLCIIVQIVIYLNNLINSIDRLQSYQIIQRTQRMYQQPSKTKPKFSEPPDPSITNINNIMFSIQQKQEQILKLLNKYKQALPEDNTQKQSDIISGYQRFRVKAPINQSNSLGKSINKIKSCDNKHKNVSKTISFDKKYEQYLQRVNTINQINQRQIMQNEVKKLKLPHVQRRSAPKSKQEVHYQKVNKNYNQNVIKFYQSLKNKVHTNIHKQQSLLSEDNKIDSKRPKIRERYQKRKIKGLQNNLSYPKGINQSKKKQDNIFNIDQLEQENFQVEFQHQIAKPIAIRPYTDFNQIYEENNKGARRTNGKKQQQDDNPTQVPMNYYVREFNQKLKQQSLEQINYLYFSKADESQSNKQWAEQIIRIFQKHDSQLEDMHRNMKYLQVFDEGFFTAGVYQTNQYNIKK